MRGLFGCYCCTFLLSAVLLFSVQPLVARLVLPLYGGSAAVWTTCMAFFQATLLIGYGYAHVLTACLPRGSQRVVHSLLVAAPLLVLPLAIPADFLPATHSPSISLLWLLTLLVGGPLVVVSSTAPLLQRWFSDTVHPAARDPYFFYAISNAGSMFALLSYPLVVEPALGLAQQRGWWSIGYTILAGLIVACAILSHRVSGAAQAERAAGTRALGLLQEGGDVPPAVGIRREWLGWVLLALAPSSWMLGVTSLLTTDIASFPLLWVIPLTLYLLTFVLVFARRPILSHDTVKRLFPCAILLLVVSLIFSGSWQVLLLHLLVFFLAAMFCHGELARRRPPARQLTQFYLWMSLGGVLGGVFNAIVAPALFNTLLEFPLAVVLACLLYRGAAAGSSRRADLLLLAGTVGVIGVLLQSVHINVPPRLMLLLIAAVPAVIVLYMTHRPKCAAAVVLVVLLWSQFETGPSVEVLSRARSFYGVHVVVRDTGTAEPSNDAAPPRLRRLLHGTTQHGFQHVDPARACQPLAYYHRSGPLGDIFAAYPPAAGAVQRVAVIGLGTGAMACYSATDRLLTFYEIDPVVKRLAETPSFFSYLSQCGGDRYRIVLGDGRLKMLEAEDGVYSMIILDAFLSDAIPVHLLTREAIEIYFDKLAAGGILVFHISNRHVDLATVLGDHATAMGLAGLICRDSMVTDDEARKGKVPSTYAVLARGPQHLGGLSRSARWAPLPPPFVSNPWTDDYSNLISVLRLDPRDVSRGRENERPRN